VDQKNPQKTGQKCEDRSQMIIVIYTAYIVSLGLGFLVLTWIIGFFVPQNMTVTLSTTLSATATEIFESINDLRTWQVWSAWSPEKMNGYVSEFSGPDSGVGQVWTWSETKYPGEIKILESEPNQRFVYAFSMDMRPSPMISTISIKEQDGQTEVRWENAVDWGSRPLSRLVGFLFGKQMLLGALKFGLKSLEQRVNEQRVNKQRVNKQRVNKQRVNKQRDV